MAIGPQDIQNLKVSMEDLTKTMKDATLAILSGQRGGGMPGGMPAAGGGGGIAGGAGPEVGQQVGSGGIGGFSVAGYNASQKRAFDNSPFALLSTALGASPAQAMRAMGGLVANNPMLGAVAAEAFTTIGRMQDTMIGATQVAGATFAGATDVGPNVARQMAERSRRQEAFRREATYAEEHTVASFMSPSTWSESGREAWRQRGQEMRDRQRAEGIAAEDIRQPVERTQQWVERQLGEGLAVGMAETKTGHRALENLARFAYGREMRRQRGERELKKIIDTLAGGGGGTSPGQAGGHALK